MTDGADFKIRSLNYDDVNRIHAIDQVLTMESGERDAVDLWSLIGESTTSFGADVGGELAGFVLADVRPWEFGAREQVGWVIAIGVHPDHQGKGIGEALGERVVQEFKKLGVRHVSTLVATDNPELRKYFEALGFKEAPRVVLEKEL